MEASEIIATEGPSQEEIDEREDWEGALRSGGHDPETWTPLEAPPSDVDAYVDHCLERLRDFLQRLKGMNATAQARKDMIESWRQGEEESVSRSISFWEHRLSMLKDAIHYDGGKVSKTLPHGKVGTQAKGGGITFENEDMVKKWAHLKVIKNPEGDDQELLTTTTTQSVKKGDIKKWIKASGGEIPDPDECGWDLEDVYREFYYKV